MFFNKVNDDQAVSTEDTSVKTSKRVRFAKNTNDETTHQTTADKAEEILNPKK